MRTVVCAVAALLLLAGCGGASKAATDKPDPATATADYLSVVQAAEGTSMGSDRKDPANPYNATMDKADLKLAHTVCKALDSQPEQITYDAALDGAGGDAMAKLRIDAAIGAFCPQHLNLKR